MFLDIPTRTLILENLSFIIHFLLLIIQCKLIANNFNFVWNVDIQLYAFLFFLG